MAPPKIKLHNNSSSGKLKSISKTCSSANSQPGPSTSSVAIASTAAPPTATENEQQFELELYWCVQQLETTLQAGKLNPKQAQDTEKNIKILKSPAQPVIKKRQLMRQLFGDYRTKMVEEEQKLYSANRRIQFTAKTKPNKKSHFVKKSALLSALKNDKDFQFNFKLDDKLNGLNLNEVEGVQNLPAATSTTSKSCDETAPAAHKFQHSGNEFRFNFSVDDNHNEN